MKNPGRAPFLWLLCLLATTNIAMAAGGGKGHAPLGSGPRASGGTQAGRGGGSGRHDARIDERHAPALAPDRKVSEQDCSKPVDVSAGNLKCK